VTSGTLGDFSMAEHEDAEDPLVTRYVEAALAPHVGRLPPDALEALRAQLYLFYETSPEAVALLNEIREAEKPAPVVMTSGAQVRRDPEALKEVALRPAKRGQR
jgi:hypothetical protein